MTASPYQPEDLAHCRHLVTHAETLLPLDPADRADILRMAYDILRSDRAHRVAAIRRPRPRLVVTPRGDGPDTSGTPGDAA